MTSPLTATEEEFEENPMKFVPKMRNSLIYNVFLLLPCMGGGGRHNGRYFCDTIPHLNSEAKRRDGNGLQNPVKRLEQLLPEGKSLTGNQI
jgi:hypothetical protein